MPLYTLLMPKARKKPRQEQDTRLIEIGKSIQTIRKRRGYTQNELGKKIGLTREAIASYETGRTQLLITTLMDMASIFRVSVNEILGLERKNPEITITRRWAKRMIIVENLDESIKKHILRTLDDVIKANTRLSIFDD